jgi:ethanolamine ammonia-lyase large subunit
VGYAETIGGTRYIFPDVKTLLAKATPRRSGDLLAGIAAADATERVAAQRALANLPVRELVENPVVPYEADEVTRLIVDSHDCNAFALVSAMSVGELRDWPRMRPIPQPSPGWPLGLPPKPSPACRRSCGSRIWSASPRNAGS